MEFGKGEEPSTEWPSPELMASGEPGRFARVHPETRGVVAVSARSLATVQLRRPAAPWVQTSSEATNMQKFGWGQAQLVGMLLE